MKRVIAAVFAAVFLALSVCAGHAADFSMDLSITVPQQYRIRFSVEGEGTVTADRAGKTFDVSDGGEVVVQQGESLTLGVISGEGYVLSGLSVGGEEMSGHVKNGVLTTPGFQNDQTVSVVFKRAAEEPTAAPTAKPGTDPPTSVVPGGKGTLSTGDLFAPAAAVIFLFGAAAVIIRYRKKTKPE